MMPAARSASTFEKMSFGSATVPVNPPLLTITSAMTALERRSSNSQNSSCPKSDNGMANLSNTSADDRMKVSWGWVVICRRRPNSKAADN